MKLADAPNATAIIKGNGDTSKPTASAYATGNESAAAALLVMS